jgi:hypothetical protein
MDNEDKILNSKVKVLFQALNLQLIYNLQAMSESIVVKPRVSFNFRVERGEPSDLVDSFIISRKNENLFWNIILELTGFNFFASSFKARRYNLYDDNYVLYFCYLEYSLHNSLKSPTLREYRETDLYKAFLIETREVKSPNGIFYKKDSVSVPSELNDTPETLNHTFFYCSE